MTGLIAQRYKMLKMNVTKAQYEFALVKIEELLPLVPEDASPDDKDAVELSIRSDVVIEYE